MTKQYPVIEDKAPDLVTVFKREAREPLATETIRCEPKAVERHFILKYGLGAAACRGAGLGDEEVSSPVAFTSN